MSRSLYFSAVVPVLFALFALRMLLTLFKLFLLVVRRSFALNFCHLPCSDSVPSSLSLSSRWLSKLPRGYSASLPRSTLSVFLLCPSSCRGRAGSSFCLPSKINCKVFHAPMFAIGPSLELPWVAAFFQGQCSRCDSRRLRRSDSIGTSSFLLISFNLVSEDSHKPSLWKQWSHTASEMRDSESPDQPKRANAKATISEGDDGGVVELNRFDGMRCTMSFMLGSG